MTKNIIINLINVPLGLIIFWFIETFFETKGAEMCTMALFFISFVLTAVFFFVGIFIFSLKDKKLVSKLVLLNILIHGFLQYQCWSNIIGKDYWETM